jgi:transposase
MTVRRYSDEFKKNALNLFKTSGKKLSQLERELGIPHGLLRQWQANFEIAVPSGKLVLNEVESLMAENKQLRRELEIVTMEREILKKQWESSAAAVNCPLSGRATVCDGVSGGADLSRDASQSQRLLSVV